MSISCIHPILTSRYDVTSDVINIKSTFLKLIVAGLSRYDVKMNLFKIFRNFQNGRHFDVRRTFKPEDVPEVESHTKIGHAIPYIL